MEQAGAPLLDLIEDASDESDVEMYLLEYELLRESRNNTPVLNCYNLGADTFRLYSRFEKTDFPALRRALGIPDVLKAKSGSSFLGDDALFITLRRLAYPSRLKDIANAHHLSYSQISVCVDAVVNLLYDNWMHLMSFHQSQFGLPKLQRYAELTEEAGCPLTRCVGFIDGTLRPMCRPTAHQRVVYNGHKRQHGLKYQFVVTPDGIISHISGPYAGTRHDCFILADSGLLPFMEGHFLDGTEPFCLYGDAAYPVSQHLLAPYKGAQLTYDQHQLNKTMSRYRVAVEWAFGIVETLFAIVDFKKNQKLYLQPLAKYYLVASLLTNCHTCSYGSQVCDLFDAEQPRLDEHLVPA